MLRSRCLIASKIDGVDCLLGEPLKPELKAEEIFDSLN
jgi:hypothetical protein